MAKGMDSKKAAKKKPAKTADEKRADKKAKKSETGLFGHRVRVSKLNALTDFPTCNTPPL